MRILVTRSALVLRKLLSFNPLRVCSLSAQEIGKNHYVQQLPPRVFWLY